MNTLSLFPTLSETSEGAPTLQLIQLTTNRKYSSGQLQQCWAQLIRLYTTRSTVFFVYIRSSSTPDGGLAANTRSNHATLARLVVYEEINVGPEIQMIYRSWKPIESRSIEEAQVNTAIILSSLSCKIKDGDVQNSTMDKIPGMERVHLRLISSTVTSTLVIQYAPHVIPPFYAQFIAHAFEKILICNESGAPPPAIWSELALLFQEDHFAKWNSPAPTPINATLHGLVLVTTKTIPKAEAICSWDGTLSYKSVEELSDTLAQLLIQMGIERGAYVGYAFEKSPWAVIAMLGILKAGAAFVALDPTQSTERLQLLQEILGCSMVITSELHVSRIEKLSLKTVVLPRDLASDMGKSTSARHVDLPVVESNDVALILFTSGSTGQPKAIIHTHGSICSHAVALGDAMGYQGARVLQFSTYTWDVAVMDIFITLTHGGCVCIPSEEQRLNGIGAFISWSRADLALLTPSFARSIDPDTVPSFKTLALAGECMTHEDVRRWHDGVTLINAYGPAEVGVCAVNILKSTNERPERIGKCLRNSPCWIVHPENVNRLLPPGAIGELVVAGPNLARGYLNHPDPTSDPFVESPAWAVTIGLEYSRFYKTGDLVSYDLQTFDGSMNFMGRKDDQIKVRGQRIEPGEVEYHLKQMPEVEQSLVVMPHCGLCEGELVAVVQTVSKKSCLSGSETPNIQPVKGVLVSKIQQHLDQYLPRYMVPTAFFIAPGFPMTVSMKIDRREVKGWVERTESRGSSLINECKWLNDPNAALKSDEYTAWEISSAVDDYIRSINRGRQISIKGYNISLKDIAFDSIQIITLFSILRNRFSDWVVLPFCAVLNTGMTIRDIAELVDDPEMQSRTDLDELALAEKDAETPPMEIPQRLHIQPLSHDCTSQLALRNVFVTGASGYLGRKILRGLLRNDGLHIYVHLRGHNEANGKEFLKEIAVREGWWDESFASRYTVWPGDLAKPALGLDQQHFELLQGKGPASQVIHGVIHCGAVVHYTLAYSTLRQANVISTATLLEATAASPFLQRLVFISGGSNPSVLHDTETRKRTLWNGYSKSKFVCEQMIQKANEDRAFDGKQVVIVHPGYIIGSVEDGCANKDDFFWRMIAGCIEIGTYNSDAAHQWVFVSDVATVSRVAVDALMGNKGRDDPEHYILNDGLHFRDIWSTLRDEFGYNLTRANGDGWLRILKDAILQTGESHNLFPLLPTLETQGLSLGEWRDPTESTSEPDPAMMDCMRMNIKYLIGTGFFPQPPSPSPATEAE